MSRKIRIHFYPYQLTSKDVLTDGPSNLTENLSFKIEYNSFLVWLDLMPEAKFTHPTVYILISANNTRIQKGGWWPILNGQKILYGQSNPVTITFPLELDAKDIDPEALLSGKLEKIDSLISYSSATEIYSVNTVEFIIFRSNPPILHISVTGSVRTPGWTNPRLKPQNPGLELKDGIKEFVFVADPPNGTLVQDPRPIAATYQYYDDFSKWDGICVYSDTNSVLKKFGKETAYEDSGYILRDLGELPHGNLR